FFHSVTLHNLDAFDCVDGIPVCSIRGAPRSGRGPQRLCCAFIVQGEDVPASRLVALVACVLAAGACAGIDRADPRHDTINPAAANASNESILLNIIRASHSIPLNFVAFSRVSGSQSAQASVGLPSFGLGPLPLVTSVQKQTVFGSSVFNANTN